VDRPRLINNARSNIADLSRGQSGCAAVAAGHLFCLRKSKPQSLSENSGMGQLTEIQDLMIDCGEEACSCRGA